MAPVQVRQKPRLHLSALSGVPEKDLEQLVALYEKLTSRKPTPQELAEALAVMMGAR